MTKAFGTEGQGGTAVFTRQAATRTGRTWRGRSPLARLLAVGAAACLIAYALGFLLFLDDIARYRQPADRSADGIVVLTGGRDRIDEAVRLLEDGKGERLLISGVHASTSRATLANAFAADQDRFACCVDIDRAALDTIGNAIQAAAWATGHGYASLLVVTNDYHMPRSLLEFGHVMPGVDLVPHAVVALRGDGESTEGLASRYRVLLGEYVKYGAAWLRTRFAAPRDVSAPPAGS